MIGDTLRLVPRRHLRLFVSRKSEEVAVDGSRTRNPFRAYSGGNTPARISAILKGWMSATPSSSPAERSGGVARLAPVPPPCAGLAIS